jgi:hypothetical protein
MEGMLMNKDLEIIEGRASKLFKKLPQTIYRINIVNDKFDKTYNFFMEIMPRIKRIKSMPLHTVKNHDLEYLENLLIEFRKKTTLSFDFVGFQGMVWPSSGKKIQLKTKGNE